MKDIIRAKARRRPARTGLLLALLTGAVAVPGAIAGGASLTLDGSTTVGPIAKAFAEYYMEQNPNVNITVSESGSGNGAKSLINGTCDIANMSRFMKVKEFKAAVAAGVMPVAHMVALDGIAVIVHPSNPVRGLTVAQVRDIYTGKVTNWKSVGGPDRRIIAISRDTNSGTYETFEKKVLRQQKIVDKAEYVGSNGAARARVQATPTAIGYVGIGFLDTTTKALRIDDVQPSMETVKSGKYPISRPLFMFTNGFPVMGTHLFRFINICRGEKGQDMVEEIGFIPTTSY